MGDVRYVAWAGYQFDYAETTVLFGGSGPPDLDTEDIGETQISARDIAKKPKVLGKDMRPTLVAFPPPTI